jgi:hypothetical protein
MTRVALVAVTIAVALLLLTAFSLQSVVYSQIIQQSYAQKPASPITDGNASSSTTTTDNNDDNTTTTDRIITPEQNASEDQRPLPVEPDGGPGGQPGEPGGPTTEPQRWQQQQQPPPQQTVDNNLTQTDGILTATINGANFTRNQMIEVKGKVDDKVITPESGVWIAVKDPKNETTHIDFVPLNAADKSFSASLVAGYYDGNSYGFYKPMTVSGKNYTMTVAYNTDGPSSTTSSGNKSEVQFVFAYDHSITTEPQQPQPPPQQIVDSDNNLTKTDGILTATINGANFTRNQTITVEGTVDDTEITPESGVWIAVKDPKNETTHAIFVPVNPSDKSFSYGIVAGYYDRNSRGFWTPMTVSGKNYTMTVVYNTDNGPSSTPSGNNKSSSEVQFVFAYDHSSTTPPPVSAAVTAEDTGPAPGASQFAGNQSTTTTTNMTTTAPAPPPTKTNGLLTASINGTHFTTNQTIAVNGTVEEAAGPFIAVYVELKDPHNDTLAFEFAPVARNNETGSDNETSFSYSLVAGDDDSDAASDSDSGHNKRFWKPMNETGNNYTMIIGYATPAPSSPGSVAAVGGGGEYSRSEVQFVFAYEHLLPPEEEGAAVATTTTTTTPAEEPEPEPVVEPEEPEEEVSEEDGDDCDNSYPDECIPPPPPNLDCSDIDEDDFEVRRSDPHGFDDDNDGMGCETAPQA